jgi:hypothetical protein
MSDIQTPQYDSDSNRDLSALAESDKMKVGSPDERTQIVIDTCNGYLAEAQTNRQGGLNPRDDKWRQNMNLYWGRYDMGEKASWQAQEVMPEVSSFVDRFAGALKEALVSSPGGFYTVDDPNDEEGDLTFAVKSLLDVWLSKCGRNQTGTCLDFASVFEEQVKLGAMKAMCATVTWKGDTKYGRVAVETTDPANVWLDTTYRNLYRVRTIEVDKHELRSLVKKKDARGRPLYNLTEIDRMIAGGLWQGKLDQEMLTGDGQQASSTRQPIRLDEYIATVVDNFGNVVADQSLIVIANGRYLIRGPEKNPFWHKKDWMVFAPLVTTPLSVYGRSYMEDFGTLAETFNELTNLILDAVRTSAMKVFAIVPEMLVDPAQADGPLTPNKLFRVSEGSGDLNNFIKAVDLGTLPPEAVTVWQNMKNELREAADINEIGLGQFAPKGRTSATEIVETKQSSSALIRSVAQTAESRFLDPVLDLVWQTGVQHCDRNDTQLAAAVGPDLYRALMANRKELVQRNYTFQARGMSGLMAKSEKIKTLLSLLGVINQSQGLQQAFLQAVDLQKLLRLLFALSDINLDKLTQTQREQTIAQVAQPIQGLLNAPGAPQPNGAQQAIGQDAANMLGVAA